MDGWIIQGTTAEHPTMKTSQSRLSLGGGGVKFLRNIIDKNHNILGCYGPALSKGFFF